MEETVKYLGCKIKGTSVTLKADFYLLCQCCQSQGRAKQCFGVDIVANPQKPNDMRPFDVLPSGNTIYDEVKKQQDANLTPAYLAYTAGCRNIISPYEQCYRNHGKNATTFLMSSENRIIGTDKQQDMLFTYTFPSPSTPYYQRQKRNRDKILPVPIWLPQLGSNQ